VAVVESWDFVRDETMDGRSAGVGLVVGRMRGISGTLALSTVKLDTTGCMLKGLGLDWAAEEEATGPP
jgi:hypothetical protein